MTGREKSWKTLEDKGSHPELDKPSMGECWGGRWWKDQTEPPVGQRQRGTDRQRQTQTDRQPPTMEKKTNNREATWERKKENFEHI